MNISTAFAILRLLGTRSADALSVRQIVAKWDAVYTNPLHLRSAQRYMSELSADSADGGGLVVVDDSGRERRYYLRLGELAHLLMSDEAALYQVLSLQVLQSTFGDTARNVLESQIGAAQHLAHEQMRTRRLRDRVRIVPDGIGRMRARVEPQTLVTIMDALASNQRVEVEYKSSKGNDSLRDLAPLGLVAKDGSLYLLAVLGLSDPVIAYPLHRMKSACLKPVQAQGRADFNLDDYIASSHQLSHKLEEQPEVTGIKLRVSPDWLYHFEERPLCEGQTIVRPQKPGEWAVLTAPIPLTHMLRPFLASMGPGLEVLEPPILREQMKQWLRDAVLLYEPAEESKNSGD